jgi:glycosyltransferase involved in cell wall biosynthesis
MYLITIHVPIYLRGSECLLETPWKRALILLRDSLGGRYGKLRVVSPSIDVETGTLEQMLEPVQPTDEIELFPSFPLNTRARSFWLQHLRTWHRELARHVPHADVVHAGFDDVYRPISFIGFLIAHRAGKPTVFVEDIDQVVRVTQLARSAGFVKRIEVKTYSELYERSVRYGVARASLSLLKGTTLIERYGQYAKNAKSFHDTSYLTDEVIPQAQLERRVHELVHKRGPLRLVYCGRLDPYKGIGSSIEAIAYARAQGARLSFDIIGEGPERAQLQHQAKQLGLHDSVRFQGVRAYGQELLRELCTYDALLFTPTAEDTARMIFDGYAAGLPLVGYAIPYVLEREREDKAAISVSRDVHPLAALLGSLDRERGRLAELTARARDAALYHSADAWYRRRADWTHEAVAEHRSAHKQ